MKSLESLSRSLRQLESHFGLTPVSVPMVRRRLPQTVVLIVSPHPDDEVLSGGLALRLQRENGCQVINVAATLGSKASRKRPRRLELARALKHLKWEGHVLPENWREKEKRLVALLKRVKPALVIAPHKDDHHPTHVLTSALVERALAKSQATSMLAWSEYWKPQAKPNLLIGLTHETLMTQIQALALHKGEVARNPYHLLLPAWQMDSVRRGSEWLGGSGAQGATFLYGQLYRLEKWTQGKRARAEFLPSQRGLGADLSDLLV